MNTFEEQFPSLRRIQQTQFYSIESIQDCCLDKQKVKEAIEKYGHGIYDASDSTVELCFDAFKQELGL